jgi:hypothetical protein
MWFRILRGEQSFNLAKDGEFTKKIKVKLRGVPPVDESALF